MKSSKEVATELLYTIKGYPPEKAAVAISEALEQYGLEVGKKVKMECMRVSSKRSNPYISQINVNEFIK